MLKPRHARTFIDVRLTEPWPQNNFPNSSPAERRPTDHSYQPARSSTGQVLALLKRRTGLIRLRCVPFIAA